MPEQRFKLTHYHLERGHPVEVLTRWGPGGGPRNVLIRRDTGELVVRPFRGLRRPKQSGPSGGSEGRGQVGDRQHGKDE